MSYPTKKPAADGFKWVRSIYGKDGPDGTAAERYNHIPDGGTNQLIADWHAKQKDREFAVATPSSLTTCPRVIWLTLNGVEPTNTQGWGMKQRNMLGRVAEQVFAKQFEDTGMLLHWWADDPTKPEEQMSTKFEMGEGDEKIVGTPDFLLKVRDDYHGIDEHKSEHPNVETDKTGYSVAVSDAKTSRSDSFGYVSLDNETIFEDWFWYKNKLQLTAYYMLCHKNANEMAKINLPHSFTPSSDYPGVPLPEVCHLFSYALDDGIVRREVVWTPTKEDAATVLRYAKQFNQAVANALAGGPCPKCTCKESFDQSEMRFCRYGADKKGKVCESCCSDDLIKLAKEKTSA